MSEEFDKLTLFITGPTYISKRVKYAALLPEFGHRDKEAKLRLEPAMNNLKKIMGIEPDDENYKLLLIPGTGTSAMEASIRSLVADNETVLCVSVGAFGDLYHKIAAKNKSIVALLKFKPGQEIDLNILEEKLIELKPAVVVITHNETSTGVLNDVVSLGKLIRKYDALPLVDGVSILGGAPCNIKEGDFGFYCGSTQKSLGLPAGFGIAIVSKDALEKAKSVSNRGVNTDILEHAKSSDKTQTLTTTPTTLANQLYVQTKYIIEEEGIKNRFKRHEEMREITYQWIETLPEGFKLLPKKEFASPSVTCISVPEDFDRKQLKEEMRKKGYLFDPGYGKLEVSTIRIGHMGDITPEMLKKYLEKLREEIIRLTR